MVAVALNCIQCKGHFVDKRRFVAHLRKVELFPRVLRSNVVLLRAGRCVASTEVSRMLAKTASKEVSN